MSTNSKAGLLEWFRSGDRMLGYDSVFAIDKAKTDTLLTQEYIRRFKTTSYLPPISGETAPDNGYKVFMSDFVLDHPRLSFDNVEITGSRASLRMKIVGGNQVGLKQVGANWYPQRIDRIEPLVGPELRLRLDLNEVPGYVDLGGDIVLDLKDSDDFVLTFSDSARIRQLGGEFFKEHFRKLPDEKRVWSIGRIEQGDDDLLRPESFSLRTQRNPAVVPAPMDNGDSEDVDGAVLGLVRMVASIGDRSLTPGPDYRYLIPDDSEDHSATVMLERRRVILATLLQQLPREYFKELEFAIEQDSRGDLKVTAVGGWMEVASETLSYPMQQGDRDKAHVRCEATVTMGIMKVPLAGKMELLISGNDVALDLAVTSVVHSNVDKYEEVSYHPAPYIDPAAILGPWECNFTYDVHGSWNFQDIVGGVLQLSDFEAKFSWSEDFIRRPQGYPPSSPIDHETAFNWVHYLWVAFLPFASFAALDRRYPINQVRFALAKDLRTDANINDVVEKTINLNFGGAIISTDQHVPRDVVAFGNVNPRQTTFRVTPLEKVIQQGSKLAFSTQPAQQNVSWSAESVEGSEDEAGSFDPQADGVYVAPGASGIKGDFTRVRITATDRTTGYFSSALITVVKNALELSPLMEVCQVGDAGVSLKAGHVGQGELNWRILGSQAHGRLAHLSGATNTYIPGPNLQGKSFVVEEVEVSNSLTDERRTLCVITQMTEKRPSDVVVDKQDTALGRVWLLLRASGNSGVTDLKVVHGPGRIDRDADGKLYYQAVASSPANFCVIEATWEVIPGFVFDGFIVLPLPLSDHAAAYQVLEQAAVRAARR